MDTRTHESRSREAHGEQSIVEAIERAWSAYAIYGGDHPAYLRLVDGVIESQIDLDESDRLMLTDPAADPAGGAVDSLRDTLHARDIGAVQLSPSVCAEAMTDFFKLIRNAGARNCSGAALVSEADRAVGSSIALTAHEYARLSERVTGAQPAKRAEGSGRLRVAQLRSVLLGARTESERASAASWISDAVSESDEAAREVTQTLRAALRDGSGKDEALGQIRGVIGSLSPEVRAGLIHTDGAPDIDAITDMVGVLPVMETCEALSNAGLTPDNACHSTLMMFQQLATLSQGRPDEVAQIESLTSHVLDEAHASQESQALRSLNGLCSQARQEEFTPEEYMRRLHEISAGQVLVAQAPPGLDWESDAHERAHAAEIILELLDAEVGDEDLRSGHLEALARLAPSAAESGRPDLLLRSRTIAEPWSSHPSREIRDAATNLKSAALDETSLSVALANVSTEMRFTQSADQLAIEYSNSFNRVLLHAYTRSPHGPAATWIAERLANAGAGLSHEIGVLLESDPGSIEVLLALINTLDADAAFAAVQPVLLNQADPEARRRGYAAAYTLRHPWPRDLCHRAIVEEDDRIRALGVAYVIKRAPSQCAPLLSDRLLNRLGGAMPDADERAMIIDALIQAERSDTDNALADTLLGAAWRKVGSTPGVGHALVRAVSVRPNGSRAGLAMLLWRLSPNRLIAALRASLGGRHES